VVIRGVPAARIDRCAAGAAVAVGGAGCEIRGWAVLVGGAAVAVGGSERAAAGGGVSVGGSCVAVGGGEVLVAVAAVVFVGVGGAQISLKLAAGGGLEVVVLPAPHTQPSVSPSCISRFAAPMLEDPQASPAVNCQ